MTKDAPKTVGGLQVVTLDVRCPECRSTEFFALRAAREMAAHCLACGRWFQGEVQQPEVSDVLADGARALRAAIMARIDREAERQLRGDAPPGPPPRGLFAADDD